MRKNLKWSLNIWSRFLTTARERWDNMRRTSSLFLLIGLFALFLPTVSAQVPEFTSSDVADAAEKLTGRRAHMTNEIRLLTGTRLAGPAITLRLVRDDKASSTDAGLATIKLLESAAVGSVVV